MGKHGWVAFTLFVSLAAVCAAQVPVPRNVLTNQGVITLAKAGFDEEFVLDAIASSRTRFDTSVDGLADLVKQGLSERIIRMMMAPAPASAAAPRQEPQAAPRVEHTTSLLWGLFKRQTASAEPARSADPAAVQPRSRDYIPVGGAR